MVAVREGLKNFSYNLWIGNFVLDSMLGEQASMMCGAG